LFCHNFYLKFLKRDNRFESGFAALAAGRHEVARQERGPERALRWQGERTLSKLLPSDICKAIIPSDNYSITAKMSPSVAIKYSLSSTLISDGPYFENKTLSPGFTDKGIIFPSSVFFPSPIAITFPCSDFSLLAVSGKKMPAFVFSSSLIGSIKMWSLNGLIFICFYQLIFIYLAQAHIKYFIQKAPNVKILSISL
jgi:hypothetical protein